MELKSPLFKHGEAIPEYYTCLGLNVNPPLMIENIPSDAKSLVLVFEDVDATPKPWTHWMLFNIPPATTLIKEASIPKGTVESLANNHSFGYEGPCPKYFKGTHHYWFRLHALDTKLDLPAATEREVIEERIKGHIIEKAELLGLCTAPA